MNKPFTEFPRFRELFTALDVPGLKTTHAYDRQLEKDAIQWYTNHYGATFGVTPRDREKKKYGWAYQYDLLVFRHPAGNGLYGFIIQFIHIQHWASREFKQGKTHARRSGQNENPYSEADFYRHIAWNCGYRFGSKC